MSHLAHRPTAQVAPCDLEAIRGRFLAQLKTAPDESAWTQAELDRRVLLAEVTRLRRLASEAETVTEDNPPPRSPKALPDGPQGIKYSGECCGNCGSGMTIRTGTCLKCLSCYQSSGGCE